MIKVKLIITDNPKTPLKMDRIITLETPECDVKPSAQLVLVP